MSNNMVPSIGGPWHHLLFYITTAVGPLMGVGGKVRIYGTLILDSASRRHAESSLSK